MTVHAYRYAGLRVASDLVLPEWQVFEEPVRFADPDVVIRRLTEARSMMVHRAVDVLPRECRFFLRDAGEYHVRDGREIDVIPEPGAGEAEIRLFILGSAFGTLAYQRGLLCLHASVIAGPGGAVAFCGPSGSGKSTTATLLHQRGHDFVSDDLCRFAVASDHTVCVYPSTPRLKLWRDVLVAVGRDDAELARDHRRNDKFIAQVTHRDAITPVPVRAVYLLDWGPVALTRLRGLDALRALVEGATYQPGLLSRMNEVAPHWQRCAALAERVPVFRLVRPRDLAATDAMLNVIERHLAEQFGIVTRQGAGG